MKMIVVTVIVVWMIEITAGMPIDLVRKVSQLNALYLRVIVIACYCISTSHVVVMVSNVIEDRLDDGVSTADHFEFTPLTLTAQ
jgi:hypothetical protein